MRIYIGEKIKQLRKEKKILQKNLCSDVINKSTMCKIENNLIEPSIQQLLYISKALGVDFSYFLEVKSTNIKLEHSLSPLNSYSQLLNDKRYFEIMDKFHELGGSTFEDYYYLGLSYFEIDEYTDAFRILKEAIKFYSKFSLEQKVINSEKYSTCLNALSKVYLKRQNFNKSIHYLIKAKVCLESNNLLLTKIYIIIVNNLGSLYCVSEQYDNVIKICENYLESSLDCTYARILCNIHLSLNIAYFKTNNILKAIDHIKKAIFFYEYTKNYTHVGECYINYVNCLRYSKQFNKALYIINSVYSTYNDKIKVILLLQKLTIYYNLNLYDNIYEYIKHINTKYLNNKNLIDYYFLLGHSYYIGKNLKKSHYYYNKCITSLIRYNRYLDLYVVYNDLGLMLNSKVLSEKSNYFLELYRSNTTQSLHTNLTIL